MLFAVSFCYLTYLALRIAFAGARLTFIEHAKQMHADLVRLGHDGSYGRVTAFARAWREDWHRAEQTTGRGTYVPLAALNKTRLKGRRGQRDMRVQRRMQLERLRLACEVSKAEQGPFRAPLLGHGELVAADVEGSALPAVCRLHLDKARTTVRRQAGDIVAGTIAILLRHPPDLARKIVAAR